MQKKQTPTARETRSRSGRACTRTSTPTGPW
jgi:hypothetical protein